MTQPAKLVSRANCTSQELQMANFWWINLRSLRLSLVFDNRIDNSQLILEKQLKIGSYPADDATWFLQLPEKLFLRGKEGSQRKNNDGKITIKEQTKKLKASKRKNKTKTSKNKPEGNRRKILECTTEQEKMPK